MSHVFERFAAVLFLLLLFGMVLYLAYQPLPASSENVILMITGGLMASAATAFPKLFGVEDREKEALKSRVRELEKHLAEVAARFETLQTQHDYLIGLLVQRHVVADAGELPKDRPPHEQL